MESALGSNNQYLTLIESLNGDTISVSLVDGNVGIPELTMAQQLADGILGVEVLGVSEIGTLAAWDGAGSPLRGGLIVVLGNRRLRIRLLRCFVGLATSSAAAAAGTSDSNAGETHTHVSVSIG